MIESPDTIVVSLEGCIVKAVACTRDESLALCATILRQGDLLVTRTFGNGEELRRLVDDMDGAEFVEGTRSAILRWVTSSLDATKDDVRDSGYDGPEDDGDGDVLAAA